MPGARIGVVLAWGDVGDLPARDVRIEVGPLLSLFHDPCPRVVELSRAEFSSDPSPQRQSIPHTAI